MSKSGKSPKTSVPDDSIVAPATLDFTGGPYGDPVNWLPRMHKLVGDQLLLAKRLLSYADALDEAAMEVEPAPGRGDALGAVLDQREAVIREMTLLGEDLRPMLERFTTLATALRTAEEEAIQARVVELDAALSEVAERDKATQRTLEQRRGQIAKELAGMQQARGAASVYGGTGQIAPQAQDFEA